jgi:hypothetical protein
MDLVNEYFGNMVFTKVEQKEKFIIYAARISSSFGDGTKQYALAFVPTHLAIKNTAHLNELYWQSFQTRLLNPGYKITPQKWEIPDKVPDIFFKMVTRENSHTNYLPELNIGLELLMIHDPKKTSKYQYHSKITLFGALSSFHCVISVITPVVSLGGQY